VIKKSNMTPAFAFWHKYCFYIYENGKKDWLNKRLSISFGPEPLEDHHINIF